MAIRFHSPRATVMTTRFVAGAIGALLAMSGCSSDSNPSGGADSGTGTGGTSSGGSSSGGTSSGGKSGGASSGGSSGADGGGACTGGPVTGANDPSHCTEPDGGAIKTATGVCQTGVADAGPPPATDGGAPAVDYGATQNGIEGNDDDCKYHVKYSVAPICENAGVTFTITVTKTVDGKPVTGASPYAEATLDGVPAPSSGQKPTEKAGGVYDIGPVKFDKPGKWTVRFHFFEECSDEPEDSPHGHIAFFVNVP